MLRHVSLGLLVAGALLSACSLINAPAEVEPGGPGGGGGSGGGSNSSSSSSGMGTPCMEVTDCVVDQCHKATCEGGFCVIATVSNNTPCDDGSACTENDFCAAGVCTPGAKKVCAPSNACNTSVCDEAAAGACVETPVADGTACDDMDLCTQTSACAAGQCVPGPGCQDSECTTAACTPLGCVDTPKVQGTSCGNTDCSAGQCDNQGNCVITPLNQGGSCDDGKFCTTDEHCNNQGQCLGTPTCLPTNNPCGIDGCDEATLACTLTPTAENQPCDDGMGCTLGTVCQGGVCGGATTTITQCVNNDACCPAACMGGGQDSDCEICHGIGYNMCPTLATEWCTTDPVIDPASSAQAQDACETCYGVSCVLEMGDCAGPGWGPGGAQSGAAHFGYTSGCSGDDGRVWPYGSSFTTFGYWGKN